MKITREELYEAVWKTPAVHLAKIYGISDVALGKHCRQQNIPRPGKGYWVLLELGRAGSKPPLPRVERSSPFEIGSRSKAKFYTPLQALPAVVTALRDGHHPALRTAASVELHPAILVLQTSLEQATVDGTGRLNGDGYIGCSHGVLVTATNVQRAFQFLNQLFRVLEALDCRIVTKQVRGGLGIETKIGERYIGIQFLDEVKKKHVRGWDPHVEMFCTGARVCKLLVDLKHGEVTKSWRERGDTTLDGKLGEIAAEILMAAEYLRLRDEEAKDKQRLHELEQLRREEENAERRLEAQRRSELQKATELWEMSRRLDAFVSACEAELSRSVFFRTNTHAHRWLAWAKGYVHGLNPLTGKFLAEQQERFSA